MNEPTNEAHDLVRVGLFYTVHEADICRNYLEENGVNAMLESENTVGLANNI